jgi:hypothetical protein
MDFDPVPPTNSLVRKGLQFALWKSIVLSRTKHPRELVHKVKLVDQAPCDFASKKVLTAGSVVLDIDLAMNTPAFG